MDTRHLRVGSHRRHRHGRTWLLSALAWLSLWSTPQAQAEGEHPSFFHMFRLEGDIGEAREASVGTWDFDGWLGGDYNKLWIKSEGELADSETESAELIALYSRNISEFWDAQAGLRYDLEPSSTSYLTAGIEGLAPYLFETEIHVFLSEEADVSLRIHQSNELLLTQRLIFEPYAELELFAQDVPEQTASSGFSSGEFGLQTRFEITRKFAPYLDLRYERAFGGTASRVRAAGERSEDFVTSIGIRLLF